MKPASESGQKAVRVDGRFRPRRACNGYTPLIENLSVPPI
jgi:hypothetical protein